MALTIALFFSILSPKINYYVSPFSVDWSPPFLDTRCFSFAIGPERFLVGTSIFELRKFPVPEEWNDKGNSSCEFLPLNVYVGVFNMKATKVYAYLGINRWGVGTSYYLGADANYDNYGYYKLGIGAKLGSLVHINAGYFCGNFDGQLLWPDTIPRTTVKSNTLYATVGVGLPDLWKEFHGIKLPAFSPLNTPLQVAGGAIGSFAGFFVGAAAVVGNVAIFNELGGTADFDVGLPWVAMFGGGIPGICVGFPLGYWATGKILHLDDE
ncbi:MAG: hypothetical protein PHX21_11490 [bacterium]|nr:hypothetical protein [bacterium]